MPLQSLWKTVHLKFFSSTPGYNVVTDWYLQLQNKTLTDSFVKREYIILRMSIYLHGVSDLDGYGMHQNWVKSSKS